jgi:hypothetical protein
MVDCVVHNWQGEEVGQATIDSELQKKRAQLTLFTEHWFDK